MMPRLRADALIVQVEAEKKKLQRECLAVLRKRDALARQLHDLQGALAALGGDPYFWTRQ